jgi:hypothetical protein
MLMQAQREAYFIADIHSQSGIRRRSARRRSARRRSAKLRPLYAR